MWQPWTDLEEFNREIVLLEKEFSLFLRQKSDLTDLRESRHLAEVWRFCDRDPHQAALMARIKTGHAMSPRHGINVMLLCRSWMNVGHRLGHRLDSFSFAALIHDTGHWRPDDLVHVFDPFTHAQARKLRAHVADLSWAGDALDDESKTWIAQHHEQPDGKGYPEGTKDPSLLAQALRIVDCFEGLTTFRRFRMLYSHPDAIVIMGRWAGTKFDRGLFHSFVRFIGNYPAGSFVSLASGAMGITLPPIEREPCCLVLTNAEGDPLPQDDVHVASAPEILGEAQGFFKHALPDPWQGLRPDLMNLRRVYPGQR